MGIIINLFSTNNTTACNIYVLDSPSSTVGRTHRDQDRCRETHLLRSACLCKLCCCYLRRQATELLLETQLICLHQVCIEREKKRNKMCISSAGTETRTENEDIPNKCATTPIIEVPSRQPRAYWIHHSQQPNLTCQTLQSWRWHPTHHRRTSKMRKNDKPKKTRVSCLRHKNKGKSESHWSIALIALFSMPAALLMELSIT